MQKKYKLKVKDNVVVLTGKSKGEQGEIIKVDRKKDKVFVKGINLVTKHTKASKTASGGINKIESGMHISNVAYVDPNSKKATKIGYKILENGDKTRFARKSGVVISS